MPLEKLKPGISRSQVCQSHRATEPMLYEMSSMDSSILCDVASFMWYLKCLKHPVKCPQIRPGAKYIEKYSNALQLLSLINEYN